MDSLTSLVDYSRQEAMDRALRFNKRETQIIVGCGGIGFWLGLFLAMNGFESFILIDGERIDNSNLNRLPVPQTWVGRNKAYVLKRMIRQLRPDTTIVPMQMHITETNKKVLKDYINKYRSYNSVTLWDTTDDARIQTQLYGVAKEMGSSRVKYHKLGYEGFSVGYYPTYDVWFNKDTYETGYRTTMANAMTSAISASLGVFAKGLGKTDDLNINLQKLIEEAPAETESLKELKRKNGRLLRALDYCVSEMVNDFIDTEVEEDRDVLLKVDNLIGENRYEQKYL